MIDTLSRFVSAICLPGIITLALGGCPLVEPASEATLSGPSPGVYYVERDDTGLCYFEPAAVRGVEHGCVGLDDEGSWYVGPGFYRLSEDYTWSRDENIEDMTLDEFIQLYDPPPPVEGG